MKLLNRIKEQNLIELFIDYLLLYPRSLFIDIGSHVGLYSMYAAKLGNQVIDVEAFYNNIYRFHKATNLNFLTEKIILFNNAISYKSGTNVSLNLHNNIGQQSLLSGKNLKINQNKKSMNIKTITLDDLIFIIPKQSNGDEFKEAILKIDIEGYEPYAFKSAKKLFEKLNFNIILMEWNQINNHRNNYIPEIEEMLYFLTKNNLTPHSNQKVCYPHFKHSLP